MPLAYTPRRSGRWPRIRPSSLVSDSSIPPQRILWRSPVWVAIAKTARPNSSLARPRNNHLKRWLLLLSYDHPSLLSTSFVHFVDVFGSATRSGVAHLPSIPRARDRLRFACERARERIAGHRHGSPGTGIGAGREELDEVGHEDLRGQRRDGAVAVELAADRGHEGLARVRDAATEDDALDVVREREQVDAPGDRAADGFDDLARDLVTGRGGGERRFRAGDALLAPCAGVARVGGLAVGLAVAACRPPRERPVDDRRARGDGFEAAAVAARAAWTGGL